MPALPEGTLMIDLDGQELTPEERDLLQHPLVGGVILFSRNYTELEQLETLIRDIRGSRDNPLLIGVDQEGGRVQRFRGAFTTIPSFTKLGDLYHDNPALAIDIVKASGWVMAAELISVGIDQSFSPVLDLHNETNPVIEGRSFHRDPEVVLEFAKYFIGGMNQAGMKATGKHFPGHGTVTSDSHFESPIDDRDFESIWVHDLIPFIKLAKSHLAGVMPAHVIYSAVDDMPAGFSKRWLNDILREKLKFNGVVFSDDLSMEGARIVAEEMPERVIKAAHAGCDMVLVCNNRSGVIETLEAVSVEQEHSVMDKINHFLHKKGNSLNELKTLRYWRKAVDQISHVMN